MSTSIESSNSDVALVNLLLVALWITIAAGIARHHRRLSPASPRT